MSCGSENEKSFLPVVVKILGTIPGKINVEPMGLTPAVLYWWVGVFLDGSFFIVHGAKLSKKHPNYSKDINGC